MKSRWFLILEIAFTVGLTALVMVLARSGGERPVGSVDLKVTLRGAADKVWLHRLEDGSYRYRLKLDDGKALDLTPDEFARRVHDDQESRSFLETLFNVATPAGFIWVSLGLLGQVLFTGRMLVQWLASEKEKKSVVPALFWWMSLVGSTMLLLYFIWRQDPVGVIGQAFGWFIYTRNLWLIYAEKQQSPAVTQDPGPEAELG